MWSAPLGLKAAGREGAPGAGKDRNTVDQLPRILKFLQVAHHDLHTTDCPRTRCARVLRHTSVSRQDPHAARDSLPRTAAKPTVNQHGPISAGKAWCFIRCDRAGSICRPYTAGRLQSFPTSCCARPVFGAPQPHGAHWNAPVRIAPACVVKNPSSRDWRISGYNILDYFQYVLSYIPKGGVSPRGDTPPQLAQDACQRS